MKKKMALTCLSMVCMIIAQVQPTYAVPQFWDIVSVKKESEKDFTGYANFLNELKSLTLDGPTVSPTVKSEIAFNSFLPESWIAEITVWYNAANVDPNGEANLVNATTVYPTTILIPGTLSLDQQPDDAPPVVTCPNDTTVNVDAGACGAAVTFYPPVASDDTGIDTIFSLPASGSFLNVGTTAVTYYVVDIDGDTSTCSFNVTVNDNELPTISCPANITVNNDPGACDATISVPAPVSSDNCGIASVTNDFNGTADASGTYPVGTTTVKYTAIDIHGNADSCFFTVTVIDNEVPAITCVTNINVNNDPGACNATISVAAPVYSDNCGIASVVNSFNGTNDASGTYPVGTTAVTFLVTDIHGNVDSCSFNVTVTDNELPTTVCPANIIANNDPGACYAALTVPAPVSSDNCGIASVVNSFNGTADASGNYPVGTTAVTFVITDIHGNVDSCSFNVTVSDNEIPAIACPSNIVVSTDSGNCHATVSIPAPVFSDNCGVASVMNDRNFGLNASGAYPIGTTTVTWIITDIHGNVDSCSMTVTVNDDELPLINCPVNISAIASAGTCQASVSVPSPVVTDNCGIASITNSFNGTANASGLYTAGVTTVTYVVTDIHGNVDSCSFTVTVTDVELPVISCTINLISVDNDPGACNANVTVPAPVVTDNCGIASIVNSFNGTSNASGVYPVGTTSVTFVATDIHGNVDSCSFSVVVTDTDVPTLNCTSDIIASNDSAACNAYVNVPVPVVSDNCGIASITNSFNGTGDASGLYPLGNTMVTFSVTDIHGNVSTCSFNVSVIDTELPTLVCAPNASASTSTAGCSAYVSVNSPVVNDNCTIVSVTNSYNSGVNASDNYPVGTTIVTFYATDIHGNTDSCTTTVTVTDTINPSINCTSGTTVVQTASGSCSATVAVPSPTAYDNCTIASITNSVNGTSNASGVYPVGTHNITWVVTDLSGNSDSCVQQIIVQDVEDPVLVCPTSNIVAQTTPDSCNAYVTVPTITASDNCGIASIVNSFNGTSDASGIYPVGMTVVTFVVTDIHGNQSNCAITVSVSDDEVPVITCAPNISVNNDSSLCGAVVLIPAPSASDNCGVASITNNYTTTGTISNFFPVGTTQVVYTATDAHANISTCTTSVTVTDIELPLIACVANITVPTSAGSCGGNVNVPQPFTSDNCGIATLINDYTGTTIASGNYPVGTTMVTWIATDLSGNVDSCSMSVTVVDLDAPVIACPTSNIVVNNTPGACDAYVSIPVIGATDNCGIDTLYNSINGTADASGTYPVGTTAVIYVAVDIHGNSSTCSFNVTVNDTELPVVTCPSNITVNNDPGSCGATVTIPVPVATDNCGVTSITNDFNGTSDASGVYPPGTTIVNYYVGDIHGNVAACTFNVTVIDTEAPVITCPANISVNNDAGSCGAYVTVPAISFTDNCSAPVIVNDFNGTSNASGIYPVGTTVVTWIVTDLSGNADTCTHTITVTDNQAPTVTCSPVSATNDAGNCDASITVPSPTTGDNCGVASIVNSINGTANASGVYPVGTTNVTWTVTDIHGNVGTCVQAVTVTDAEAPVIACPSNITVGNTIGSCDANVTIPAPAVSDNCGIATVTNSFNGTANASGIYPVGTTTVVFTVLDIHGNASICSFDVTVNDTEAPVVTCPANITVSNDPGVCDASVTVPAPVSTDNCGIATVTNSFNGTANASGVYPAGTTTVSYTVTDIHGNTSTCSFTVTVNDAEAPALVCPSNIVVGSTGNNCSASVTVPVPVTSDNCGVASLTNSFNGTGNASGVYPTGVTNVTWTVTDNAGLTSTCTMTVTVADSSAPVITCSPNVTENANGGLCGAFITIPLPTVTDNCSNSLSYSNDYTGTANASGFYPVGNTLVTYTAVDALGNTSTCSFTVTIVDAEAPVVLCASDIDVEAGQDSCGAYVIVSNPQYFDNCGIAYVSNSYNNTTSATDWYPVGTTSVEWTVIDVNGNVSFCTTIITVTDNTAPSISFCPANIYSCNNYVSWVQPTASDNCTLDTFMVSHQPGSAFPYGNTLVTYTALDISGNITQCSFNVIVNPAPVATFTYFFDGFGMVNFVPDYVSGTATYTWTFGDGSTTNEVYPKRIYDVNAMYNVCLVVTDVSGCSDTFCVNVLVNTSVENPMDPAHSLEIYPNPFDEQSQIVISLGQADEVSFIMEDISGKLIVDKSFGLVTEGEFIIPIVSGELSLAPGMYVVRVKVGESLFTKRIIKIAHH